MKITAEFGNHRGFRLIRAGLTFLLACLLFSQFSPTPAHSQSLTLDQWLDLGWEHYNTGDVDEAFKTFLQAVADYPDSALAHLALGEVYLEIDQVERGQNELLACLVLDDESEFASRAHYLYAVTLREVDPWNALLHLERAHLLGGTQAHQFEIARQMRFCRLMLRLPERIESGGVILHYPLYTITGDEAAELALSVEADKFLAERFCNYEFLKPIHIFIYPSERALFDNVAPDSGDKIDPAHREYHMVYSDDLDFLFAMSAQAVYDLQVKMNRHAGADWIPENLPYAIRGYLPWQRTMLDENEEATGLTSTINVSVDDAVRSLIDEGAIVDLLYLTNPQLDTYIPGPVEWAELGSFIRWLRDSYSIDSFQELITQPNFLALIGSDITRLQTDWLEELNESPSLLADPLLASRWVADIPLSPLAGDPDMPLNTLKEGLAMYLGGERVHGLWQIRHALDLDPGMALGYYTLGWIAVTRSDWTEAENQLGMAVRLFETPAEIAWCHSLLAPIYLHDHRWQLAYASLGYIVNYSDSPEARIWASEPYTQVTRILALKPDPLDRESEEFDLMRTWFTDWNIAVNSEDRPDEMLSDLMEPSRAQSLLGFYDTLKETYPSIVINHAIQAVGSMGSSMHVEVRIQAAINNPGTILPLHLKALEQGGYLIFFQLVPVETGWMIYDWEDGNFQINPVVRMSPAALDE